MRWCGLVIARVAKVWAGECKGVSMCGCGKEVCMSENFGGGGTMVQAMVLECCHTNHTPKQACRLEQRIMDYFWTLLTATEPCEVLRPADRTARFKALAFKLTSRMEREGAT